MVFRKVLPFVFAVTALLLQACGGVSAADAIQTGIAQTLQIAQLQTAAAGGQPSATPEPGLPSDTPLPSNTPTPAFTSTSSIPYVSVSTNTNCRTGNGVIFDWVTTVNVGEQVEVLKTFSFDYAIVRNPHGPGECWLWLQYANQHDFSAYNLPQATQPPTPTHTPTTQVYIWEANWNVKVVSGGTTWTGTGIFSESGDAISGSFTLNPGGLNYTFTGTMSDNHQEANGNWTLEGGGSGTFAWKIKSGNTNQFIGNLTSGSYEMCGAKNGASMPDPCEWP